MKTMKKFLSMAALAMVGAMTGCSSEDNVIDQAQTATKNNVVTQTVTVGLGEQAATRALAIDYDAKTLKKTFKANDQIAVVYQNTSDELVKATVTIAAGDISTDKKSATFTVSMTDPKASGTLKYIYPAAMAGATDVDYTKLNTQDGTLASLASSLDLATFEGTLTAASELPASATLANKLSILAVTLKSGSSDVTSTITSMTISDGTNSYFVNRSAAAGPIYAAIQPTSGATIACNATSGTKYYAKTLSSKTYEVGNFYQPGLSMAEATPATQDLSSVTGEYVASYGETLSGELVSKKKISIADGAIITLSGVSINADGSWTDGSSAGITCVGNATIILEGDNTVKGFNASYPGIYVPEGKTLTIMGSGKLTASSNGEGAAGIGGGEGEDGACGNIVISGGDITATGGQGAAGIGGGDGGACGNIVISGGTITASSNGQGAAGIGGGDGVACGNIVISGGTIIATGGEGGAGIGSGQSHDDNASCGNITISGGTIKATGGDGAAGIGSGRGNDDHTVDRPSTCGTITITSGVTSVEAKAGSGANSIGAGGYKSTCGTVTIEDASKVTLN